MFTTIPHGARRLLVAIGLLVGVAGCTSGLPVNPYPDGLANTAGAGSQLDQERGCTSSLNCNSHNDGSSGRS